jgi:lipopolysaccharide/colanic/teichoic acid biosynthesis glycosyltransferase
MMKRTNRMIQAPATNPITPKERIWARPTTRRVNRWLKASLDYALTIPTLFLISPLLLAIALLIKLESRGPILYRHTVLGRNGREFQAYKFRTMYVNADERLLANRKQWVALLRNSNVEDDPRLTPIGRFLRQYGLDELPRLFNVLERNMSLVGPRMLTRAEMLKFGHQIEGYTNVLPGMTGLWQVSGHPTLDERVRLETEYIQHWSVLLDFQILLQSVIVAFAHEA